MLLANILRAMQQPRAIGFVFLGIAGVFMMVLATAPQANAAWGSGGSGMLVATPRISSDPANFKRPHEFQATP